MTQMTDEDRALIDRVVKPYTALHALVVNYPEEVAALLSAARQARTQGPGEGFVVVPVEPTREMLKAAGDYADECARLNYGGAPDAEGTWSAMLAAAPPASLIKEG
ncbi:hypothetical protein ACFQ27_03800 [Phenylobacterium conjunctum]|uniref:Uncharacterized protein n=2 Tax=Phenylobacterium conjunctum TaxID=1298959 RepID=A0ABW3SZ07_9CAUL